MDELLPFEALEERARRRLREQERIQHRNARMIRLWNEGEMGINEIAEAVGLSQAQVEKFLSRQPGYPGVIDTSTRDIH